MHLVFDNLVITSAPSLHASFRYILEDDSISLGSKTHIHFCSGRGVGLWLVIMPSICSFHIAHSIFTSTLRFHLGLIQPSTSNLLTCEWT